MLLVVIARKHNNDLASVNWAAKDVNTSTGHGFSGDQKRVMLYVGKGPSFKTRSRFRGHSPRLDAKIRQRRQSWCLRAASAAAGALGAFRCPPGSQTLFQGLCKDTLPKGTACGSQAAKVPAHPRCAQRRQGPTSSAPKQAREGALDSDSLCQTYR